MRKENLVWKSGTGKGVKLVLLILILSFTLPGKSLTHFKINHIYLKANNPGRGLSYDKYQALITLRKGELLDRKKIKKTIENLYKIGPVYNIEAKIKRLGKDEVDLYFFLTFKYYIKKIKIKVDSFIKKKLLKNAVFSVREKTYLHREDPRQIKREVMAFMESRGYFNPTVKVNFEEDNLNSKVKIIINIKSGPRTFIKNLNFQLKNKTLRQKVKSILKGGYYIPYLFQENINRIRSKLKEDDYLFPDIKTRVKFLNKFKTYVDITVTVSPGYKYIFEFKGMRNQYDLIAPVWGKQVSEKWAERESRTRLTNFLKNRGYLRADVQSSIKLTHDQKIITFSAEKNQKYKLGKIFFSGNNAISEEELREVIKTDDEFFNYFLGLQSSSLQLDKEFLELYYYFRGFPLASIEINPAYKEGSKVDITFSISEGEKYIIDQIRFKNNAKVTSNTLHSLMKQKLQGAFIQRQINEDLENIRRYYHSLGYDDVQVQARISTGNRKSILIDIAEGKEYLMGDLVIIGASKSQETLLRNIFRLKEKNLFDQQKLNSYKNEIENSNIFNEIKISKIKKLPNIVDILVDVTPDKSEYYGIGLGVEKEQNWGVRSTLEYTRKNIFNSYSSFSTLLQVGPKETKGVVSYESPYFFSTPINSIFKIWMENEIYPTYKFRRLGIGESLIKKLSPNSYFMTSFSWYRTTLTDLSITPEGIDRLDTPFETTAINFSYISEHRDDPFNPTSGNFFSANLKVGLPILEQGYTFFRLRWSYQKILKFLKNGVFTFSLRNGFAWGDMSITERFFAGGIYTFRGTSNSRLGPIDPRTRDARGGDSFVLFNLEATFPLHLLPIDNLYYTVFLDLGNVFLTSDDFDLGKIERAIGLELKYKTAFGPFRICLAFNARKQAEARFLFLIGIGNVL